MSAPGKIVRMIQASLTTVTSTSKYSASPAHTPAIRPSAGSRLSVRRAGGIGGTAAVPQNRQYVESASSSLAHPGHVMASLRKRPTVFYDAGEPRFHKRAPAAD